METIGEFEYNSKDLIGHGAFAVVFMGRQKAKPNMVVAIKSITKKNLAKSQNLLGKEIKILKELTELHHENVVALLDCKETQNHVYLVMEYCNGGDLADYLHNKGTLSEDTIRIFLRQIAGAMKALNAKGIVHRDLKPQNILLCQNKDKKNPCATEITLKIADFGFARFLQDGVMAATLCGSPMYMAPEVIMSLEYDAKADLWSIATIVFQCLTGKAPFQAQTPQALKQFYEKNPNLVPEIPMGTSKELKHLLCGLLKRNANDRMNFEQFFNHSFMKIANVSKPVPVPRNGCSNTGISSGSFSPVQSPASYGSPVIMQVADSQKTILSDFQTSPVLSESEEQIDDFVVIQNTDRINANAKVNIELGFNKRVSFSIGEESSSNAPPDPIPVPSRCLKTMRSIDTDNRNNNTSRALSFSGSSSENLQLNSSKTCLENIVNNSQLPDISQLSPPSVKFLIGTPPGVSTPNPLSLSRRSSLTNTNLIGTRQGGSIILSQLKRNSLTPPSKNCTTLCPTDVFNSSATSPIEQDMSLRWAFHSNSKDFLSHAVTSPRINKLAFGSPSQRNLPLNEFSNRCVSNEKLIHQSPFYTPQQYHHCHCSAIDSKSPPYASGQLTFVAPELPEETLLDQDHNETLAKLNFVVALVDCIIDLAKSRTNPLTLMTESSCKNIQTENHRRVEQLILYVRALQLTSSALQLSRQEITNGRLRTSSSVRSVLKTMRDHFHECLEKCKFLNNNDVFSNNTKDEFDGVTADKLMYNYAIEMCQSAALEELFGHPEECFRRYQTGQILLHSLSQQVNDLDDKRLLSRYRAAVEKRLFVLQSQGYVFAFESSP